FGDVAEQFAVAVSLPVIEVAQDEWRTGDRQRLVDRASEWRTGIVDVNGTEAQGFIDLVLVTELRSREHADFIRAVGALVGILGSPQRLGMVGLADLVDVRPLELGLGTGRRHHEEYRSQNRDSVSQLTRPVRHTFLPYFGYFQNAG